MRTPAKIVPPILMATLLSACASSSFAPPFVSTTRAVIGVSPTRCSPDYRQFDVQTQTMSTFDKSGKKLTQNSVNLSRQSNTVVSATTKWTENGSSEETVQTVSRDNKVGYGAISHDFAGAQALIDNFMLTYRCAAHEAADGRQIFEVPSLLSAVAAVTGTAFGLNENQVLGLGTSAALFRGANSYLAPKDKAGFLDHAIDAVACIQAESVGVEFINADVTPPAAIKSADDSAPAPKTSVKVSAQFQYYRLVSASLIQVERVLATRLRSAGIFDADGLVAEIKGLSKAEDAPPLQSNGTGSGGAAPQTINDDDRGGTNTSKPSGEGTTSTPPQTDVDEVFIGKLKPRLQLCVVRAKL